MLSRTHRLLADKDFAHLFKRGFSVSAGPLTLKALKTSPERPTRVGIVVGVKVAKRAVVRNTLKRRLRELLRVYLPALGERGADAVIITRPGAASLDFASLKAAVHAMMEKLLGKKL